MRAMKKVCAFMLALCMVIALMPGPVFAAEDATVDLTTVDVTTAQELITVLAKTTETPVEYKNLTINIKNDIDASGLDWASGFVNGYNGAEVYTINGNNHKITGLTGALIDGTWAGNGQLIIKDLTIADSKMQGGADNHGFGAFIGHTEATSKIELNNCHLLNCELTGADWTGGFIGYAAGYNVVTDGPVEEHIDIINCSVKNSKIQGAGSTGALFGHATGNAWTWVNVVNTVIEGNTITCTDDSDRKAGSVVGTVGIGEVSIDAIVKDNTVKSGVTSIDRLYGRFGSGGNLYITGGKYYDVTLEGNEAPEGDDVGKYEVDAQAIFKNHMFDVTVTNGTADKTTDLLKGDVVTITATVAENTAFEKWEVVKGNVTLADATKTTTTFVVTDSDVEVKAVLSCTHPTSAIKNTTKATCTVDGYTGDKTCGICGTVLEKGTAIPATGHTFVDGVCACGLSIKVEAEVVDTVTTSEVKVEEVKEVTVVESTETKQAENSVKAEATEIVATVMTEGTDKLVEDKVVTEETAANLEAVTEAINGNGAEMVEKGLLTAEEVKVIEETVKKGETVVVAEITVTEVETKEVTTSVQKAIEEKATEKIAKDAVVAQYLDVSVVLKAAGKELGTIDKLDKKITITVAIPENLKADNRAYYVLRNHDGVVEVLPTTLNADGTISFTTDQFSTYALAYAEKAPNTGDNSAVMTYAVMAVAALAVVVVLKKRNSFSK